MHAATHTEVVSFLLAVATLLVSARALGELARRVGQPAVLGEIVAGILLGPTVLGALAPAAAAFVFPEAGPSAAMREGLTMVAVTLFLLVAGLEVDLGAVRRQGRAATLVSLGGIIVPFGVGLGFALALPDLLGYAGQPSPVLFALFFATALAISALPVIARTLMDLGLFRTDLGMVVIAAAIVDDLVGWIVFAVLIGALGGPAGHGLPIAGTVGLTLGFTVAVVVVVRPLVNRALPWVHARTAWPGGVLAFAVGLAMLFAALTEWMGVHAVFGSFMAGIALGDSRHLRAKTRETIDHFVSSVLAPLFFASIGLRVDFAEHFDITIVLVVLAVATVGKVVGAGLGARLGGLPRRESWAVGIAMNARGAMEIIFALLALQMGVITEPLFVALVVMALVTSVVSGPLMMRALRRRRASHFTDFLRPATFAPALAGTTPEAVVRELAALAAPLTPLTADAIAAAALRREAMMATGMGQGVAVPHASLPGLSAPIVALGLSAEGVDFEAPDGRPSRVVCLVLTPDPDDGRHLEIIASIAHTFSDGLAERLRMADRSYVELLAALKADAPARGHG